MKISCPKCQQAIDPSQINVATDVAFCTACNEAFSLAKLVAAGKVETSEPGEPPEGCWFRSDGDEWEAGVSTRSYIAWILAPFALIWSGATLGTIFGIQLIQGKFDANMSLFGLPFALFSIPLVSFALMSVYGKAVLNVRDDRATLFVGVGPLGRRRSFPWSQISRVCEAIAPGSENDNSKVIQLDGPKKPIRFGTVMSDERRAFLIRLLRRMVVDAASSPTSNERNPAR